MSNRRVGNTANEMWNSIIFWKNFKLVAQFFVFKFVRSLRKRSLKYDAIISYGGFIVSVAVLTAALSLLNGYYNTLKQGLLDTGSHLYVYNSSQRYLDSEDYSAISQFLEKQPSIKSYSPVILTQAMVRKKATPAKSATGKTKGIIARSIEWQKPELPIKYKELIVEGSGELVNNNDVVIGTKLAQQLDVTVGDKLIVISPANMRYTLFGLKTGEVIVSVKGIYSSGVYETDTKTLFMNKEAIRSLIGNESLADRYTLIEVKVKNNYIDKVNYLSNQWNLSLGYHYQIDNWIDYNGNLFTMLTLQKWVIFIILSFIILIASFGIASNTTKTVMEKQKEIGILSAIGADKRTIKAYLMGETTIFGLISIIVGILMGIIISWLLTKQTFFMLQGNVYFIERFHLEINIITVLAIIIVSLFIALTSSLLSLRQISKLTIIESMTGR